MRLQLHYDYEAGADEEVITVLAKRRCIELEHDNDTPQIVNIDDALVAYAVADLLERERQFGKAAAKVQEAIALVNGMLLAERDQNQNHSQIIPVTETYAEQSALY
jgi:non-ribosomal peptide synthetase component F